MTDSVPPAEIKGGYSFYQIRLSSRRLYSRGDIVDILLAFNQEAYDRSIGLAREPEAALIQWSGASPFRAPYLRTARAAPAEDRAALTALSAEAM